jgi:hypothetical protein
LLLAWRPRTPQFKRLAFCRKQSAANFSLNLLTTIAHLGPILEGLK